MLEPLGYRVLSVATGRELLDRAPTARPDVILMDANLRDLDSITVCRTLRQHRAVSWHTPILDRKSTRLNSSHGYISYAVFCLKKKKKKKRVFMRYYRYEVLSDLNYYML